jgi:hypothetical protein
LDGLRVIVENTGTETTAKCRNLYLEQVLNNSLPSNMVAMVRDTTAISSGTLPPALNLGDSYASGEVATAQGAAFTLESTGASKATSLIALVLSAKGATTTNYALLASDGDIVIDSDGGKLWLGEDQDASISYSTSDIEINPQEVGSGDVRIVAGDLQLTTGNLNFGAGTQTIAGIQNQNLLDKSAAETVAGTWHFAGIDFDDNALLRFGTGNDVSIKWTGSNLEIQGPTATTERIWIRGKSEFSWPIVNDSVATNWIEAFTQANSTSETGNDFVVLNVQAAFASGANRGRNFAKHTGIRGEAIYNRTTGVDWPTQIPSLVGGNFSATYAGVGRLTGSGDPKLHGGQFQAECRSNPDAPGMTVSELWGGNFRAIATAAMGRLIITDAIAGRFDADVSGAGTVTRNYGILVENVTTAAPVTTAWGINVDGADVQISSDNWLLLEGSGTAKGDSGIRFDSGNTRLQFQVNNTDNILMGASTLGFFGTAPASQSAAYTVTNPSADRAYDAGPGSTTVDELARVLGTVITDLQALGLLG